MILQTQDDFLRGGNRHLILSLGKMKTYSCGEGTEILRGQAGQDFCLILVADSRSIAASTVQQSCSQDNDRRSNCTITSLSEPLSGPRRGRTRIL